MAKLCDKEGCDNPRFSKGFCKFHQWCRTDKKKPKKSISPFSAKKLEQLSEYRIVRDKYLEEHPKCEVHDCNSDTTNCHHKKGRGKELSNPKFFMACCSSCHPQRIHENPAWAREHGYLI